ncbi:hypothetical protein BJX64DRAFT_7863 [Aspergillus heterothallicus]
MSGPRTMEPHILYPVEMDSQPHKSRAAQLLLAKQTLNLHPQAPVVSCPTHLVFNIDHESCRGWPISIEHEMDIYLENLLDINDVQKYYFRQKKRIATSGAALCRKRQRLENFRRDATSSKQAAAQHDGWQLSAYAAQKLIITSSFAAPG